MEVAMRIATIVACLSVLFAIGVTEAGAKSKHKVLRIKKAVIHKVADSLEADTTPTQIAADNANVPYIAVFRNWGCRAKWNQNCSGRQIWKVPDGNFVCRLDYKIAERNKKAGVSYRPNSFLSDDPYDRNYFKYNSVRGDTYAFGSGNTFDRWGSAVRATEGKLYYLPLDASNEVIRNSRCRIVKRVAQ
jgi:hypothetical protein